MQASLCMNMDREHYATATHVGLTTILIPPSNNNTAHSAITSNLKGIEGNKITSSHNAVQTPKNKQQLKPTQTVSEVFSY